MSRVEAFVDSFLAHYASEYYDPAKAREYYLKTRELKGKRSTSDLKTEKKKQAWAYANHQIGEAKKADLTKASESRKDVVERAQQSAQARREEISTKLTNLLKLLSDTKTTDSETIKKDEESALDEVEARRLARVHDIREDANKKIDAIPKIPDGVGGAQRKRLLEARAKKVARINGDADRVIKTVSEDAAAEREKVSADADSKRQDLSAQIQDEKQSQRTTATVSREQVATQLKATIDKARADYEAGKERLIAEYEAKSQKEFDAIRTRV